MISTSPVTALLKTIKLMPNLILAAAVMYCSPFARNVGDVV